MDEAARRARNTELQRLRRASRSRKQQRADNARRRQQYAALREEPETSDLWEARRQAATDRELRRYRNRSEQDKQAQNAQRRSRYNAIPVQAKLDRNFQRRLTRFQQGAENAGSAPDLRWFQFREDNHRSLLMQRYEKELAKSKRLTPAAREEKQTALRLLRQQQNDVYMQTDLKYCNSTLPDQLPRIQEMASEDAVHEMYSYSGKTPMAVWLLARRKKIYLHASVAEHLHDIDAHNSSYSTELADGPVSSERQAALASAIATADQRLRFAALHAASYFRAVREELSSTFALST